MEITFTHADIDSLKRELARQLPDVKSSHRVEAMARGLGYNTNAALRTELTRGALSREPDPKPFREYLNDHGFADVSGEALLQAIAMSKFESEHAAIRRVMDNNPELATWGYGLLRERSQSRTQRETEFCLAREEMLTLERIRQFIRARAYLERFAKRQSFNTKISSYGLKHRAEEFHRECGADYFYVGNGMLIAAALDLGFRLKRTGINALLNIASRPGTANLANDVRPAASTPPGARKKAWSNMIVAAVNAGLEQGLFGLGPGDNRWTGARGIYRFSMGEGLPAIASVSDAGFGELIIDVLVKPRGEGETSVGVRAWSGFWAKVSDAYASGWLERAKGQWIQTGTRPIGYFRRDIIPTLAALSLQPKGYAPSGRFMM